MKNRAQLTLVLSLACAALLAACAPKMEVKVPGGDLRTGNSKYDNGRLSRGANTETGYQIPLLKLDAVDPAECPDPFLDRGDLESKIRFADAPCVKKIVSKFGINLNQPMTDVFGNVTELPLSLAVSEDSLFFNKENPALIPALLISLGADVNIRTSGASILEQAMDLPYGSYGSLAHYLIELPLTKTQRTSRGGTFLEKAIQLKSPQLISHLLDRGAEVNPSDSASSPLHQAIEQGLQASALQILQAGGSVAALNGSSETPLHRSIAHEMGPLTRAILAKNPPLNLQDDRGNTPLHLAAARGQEEPVALLLKARAELELRDSSGRTPLFVATEAAQSVTAEQLLQARSAVAVTDEAQRSLLQVATQPQLALKLIQAGAPVDLESQTGETPLSVHVHLDNLEVVKALVARGANLQWKDPKHRGLLHLAAASDALATARYLLTQGLSVAAESLEKRTPLFEVRSVAMLSLLFQAKAEINHLDADGLSALYEPLVLHYHLELAQAFLDRGADLGWGAERTTSYLLQLLKRVMFLTAEQEKRVLSVAELLLSRGIRTDIIERNSGRAAIHYLADNASITNSDLLLLGLGQAFRDHGAELGIRDSSGLTVVQKLRRQRDATVRLRDEEIARAKDDAEEIKRIREAYRPSLERLEKAIALLDG
ncbi:MAG: ankyrin repeat domain-containing protein [Oligoflexia bacterium]|nr:ankyrin repeat domain-containing protein [Oligoflexia bacterium]